MTNEKWNQAAKKAKDKLSDFGHRAGARITQGVDITKAELSLRQAERKLQNAYANFGRLMYPYESGEAERDEEKIAEELAKIAALREEIKAYTGEREEALFRKVKAGTAVDSAGREVEVEVVSPKVRELKYCPKCLMGFDEELDSCPYCGYTNK